jgi:hypothetical protein
MRVIAQDVVTRVEPQTVYVDAGILSPGSYGNSFSLPYLVNRRAEGWYDAGSFHAGGSSKWLTRYSGRSTYLMSAVHPAGLYDVYYDGTIGVYDDYWDRDGDNVIRPTWIRMPYEPITTIRVRRASTTTITASSTSFTGPPSQRAVTITVR